VSAVLRVCDDKLEPYEVHPIERCPECGDDVVVIAGERKCTSPHEPDDREKRRSLRMGNSCLKVALP
jgi:hypothetical protein